MALLISDNRVCCGVRSEVLHDMVYLSTKARPVSALAVAQMDTQGLSSTVILHNIRINVYMSTLVFYCYNKAKTKVGLY